LLTDSPGAFSIQNLAFSPLVAIVNLGQQLQNVGTYLAEAGVLVANGFDIAKTTNVISGWVKSNSI